VKSFRNRSDSCKKEVGLCKNPFLGTRPLPLCGRGRGKHRIDPANIVLVRGKEVEFIGFLSELLSPRN
jgi:hypothetical protein